MKAIYLNDDKNEADIEIDSLTIVELLRSYLARDDSVSFVAWRREHPSKNPVLKIKTKGKTVRKAVSDAISEIEKESDKLLSDFKKSK